ncbi:MAG TPA: ATPase, T2SS/T4P/T4SS family [Treponemataceae bacterium]|nr:ATPase, T2SS/T4P/T4SS family [Treponemataceae bacterium]HOS36443.1 ATPase, T2SS/T4P/T4SS family [Treponemataceae bacterium]
MNRDAQKEIRERQLSNLFGELSELLPVFENKELTDIFIYGDGSVRAEHFLDGRVEFDITIEESTRYNIIHYLSAMSDSSIDTWANPTLEGILPDYNFRVTAVLPPWVRSPEITFRRPPVKIFTLEEYLAEKRITVDQYDQVVEAIERKDNILIGGGTGSGKTTFTNACIQKMSEFTPHDRFLIIEDTPELQCTARDLTQMYIRKDQAARAVQFALRWFPKRIIFGELRSGEVARELLECWNTGHPGNITTIHADSAQTMLTRFRGMLSEVITGTLPDVSDTIQLCVHLKRKEGFGPVVDEILRTRQIAKLLDTIEKQRKSEDFVMNEYTEFMGILNKEKAL